MKRPIISSIGLAILAGVALVTQASATLTLEYSGNFGSGSTLGTTEFSTPTPFALSATFDELTPIITGGGLGVFSVSAFSFLIEGNPYTGSTGMTVVLLEPAQTGGYNMVGLRNADNRSLWTSYSTTTPALKADQPTATEFSDFWQTAWDPDGIRFTFDNVPDDLVMNNFSGPFTAKLIGVSPIPEVTSSFTLLGLVSSGLLMRRRTQALR